MAYTSEEEQEINQLKDWWKENSKVVITSLVVAFAGVFGWNYWQSYQINQNLQRAAHYDQLIYGSQQSSEAKDDELAKFVQENQNTSYAVLALLDQAKVEVENQQFDKAQTTLKQAMTQSDDDILLSIGALRLATVQWQLKLFDEALNTLNQIKDASFMNRKDLLTGDILLAKGNKSAAKENYQKVMAHGNPMEIQWAKVRLNNL